MKVIIEFDDINETPKMYLDGELIEGIVKINYEWNTRNYYEEGKKAFKLNTFVEEINWLKKELSVNLVVFKFVFLNDWKAH